MASSPSVPSLAVPERITPMARSRWSRASDSKKKSIEWCGARVGWRGCSFKTPCVIAKFMLGGITYT
jgi:hypothetical protein